MADVNYSGINNPLGRFLTVTGFGSVQSLVGVRQTPVLGYAQTVAATVNAPPATGIVATFSDQGTVAAGVGNNTQEVLNAPSNWRGFVNGIEVGFPSSGAGAIISPQVFAEFLSYAYIRITCGGIDTDIPLLSCYRILSQENTALATGQSAGRNPYFFSSPLFWAGDGSETVRLMQTNGTAVAPANPWDLSVTLHVALGRSQDNSEIQPGFGGPTNCPDGDEYMAATQTAAAFRRSVSG